MKMKAILKRAAGLLVAIAMLLSMMPTVFADPALRFTDFPNGWSRAAMTAAVDNGLLNGYEDNTIRPEDNLTRAEMTAIITRAFGAKTVADISAYTDVAADAWYYDSIAKAVQMGAVNGVSATEMNPDASITREEVFTILARVLVLSSDNAEALNKFHDASAVSSWAKPYVIALTERGYVNGDERGYANPQANITREEFAQLMHNAIRTYITKSGTYEESMDGIVVVRTERVVLKNLVVNGDLVIGDGVGTGVFRMDGVVVNGRLLARAGTNILKGSSVSNRVVVNNPNGDTIFKNYRSEVVFNGLVEHTNAIFIGTGSGGGGGGGVGPGPGPTSYSVSFKLPDGTLVGSPISVTPGQPIGAANMPADPTPGVGYDSFLGWFDGTTQITGATIVNGPINAVAKFNPVTYTIHYVYPNTVTLDGSQPPNYTIENYTDPQHALPGGAEMTLPQGEVFVGWDDDGNDATAPITALQASHIPPNADGDNNDTQLTLTLVTKPVPTWTITFVAKDQGGNSLPGYPKTPQVEQGQPIGAGNLPHPDPQIVGYGFVRWEDGSGNPITAATVPTQDMTVTAKFSLNTYTISFKDAGSLYQIENFTGDRDFTVEDSAYVLPTAAQVKRAGYTFTGWTWNGTPMTQIAASNIAVDTPLTIELVPSFSENTYTVDFGTAEQYIQNFPSGRTFTVTTLPYTLPTSAQVSRVGYDFNGWTLNGNAVTQIAAGDITVDTPLTITVTAAFTPKTYTISFGSAEQYVQNFTTNRTYTMDGPVYVLPTAEQMNRTGYDFGGWTLNGASVTQIAAGNITADTPATINLGVTFTPASYNIHYVYPNTVTLDGSQPTNYTIENYTDQQHRLPGSAAMTLPQGMVFVGWDDDGNDSTAPITELQAKHIPPTADGDNNDRQLTLTLVMEPAPTWTITFDAKDANGNSLPGYPIPVPVVRGQSVGAANMPHPDPQRVGYTFDGWKDGSGVLVDENYTPAGNITVTAQFSLKTYTISFGEAEQYIQNFPSGRTFTINSLPYTLPTAAQVSRVGYDFTGWTLNGNAVTQITASDIAVDTPLTIQLVPSFTEKTYTISFGEAEQYIQNFPSGRTFTINTLPYTLPTAAQVSRVGYDFTGWSYNGSAVTQITASHITVDTPLTLTLAPSFTEKTYTVSFGSDEQYIQNFPSGRTFTINSLPYTLPTAAQVSRVGYDFNGWSYNGTAVTQITASDITVDTPLTITVTADFTPKTYTVSFGEAEQYIQNFTTERTFTIENLPYTLPTVEQVQRAGYDFGGWSYNGNAVTQITASDITVDTPLTLALVPSFTEKTYTISFGSDEQYIQNFPSGRTFTINTLPYTLPTTAQVSRVGYDFNGWSYNGTAVTQITASDITVDTPLTITVAADFTPKTYTISFGSDEQYIQNFTTERTYTMDGSAYVLPTVSQVQRKGKTLIAWKDANGNVLTQIDASYITASTSSPIVLTAEYETKTYTVTFSGAEQYIENYTPQTFTIDTLPYTLPTQVKRVGYNFNGWLDTNGNSETQITEADITNSTPDEIVFAPDFEAKTYTIEYQNPDGSAFSYFNTGFTATTSFTVEDPAFTLPVDGNMNRVGYTFKEWIDAEGTVVSAMSAAYIKEETPDTIVLKGDFDLKPYTIRYLDENGTNLDFALFLNGYMPKTTFDVTQPDYTLATETEIGRAGYKFEGWKDADGNDISVISAATFTKETPQVIEVTADFTLKEYIFQYQDADGNTVTSFVPAQGQVVKDTFTVIEPDYILPPAKRKGYTFKGWTIDTASTYRRMARAAVASINYVTEFTKDDITLATPDIITFVADFEINTYTLNYKNATFKQGIANSVTYTIDTYQGVVFPREEDLIVPDDKLFTGWYDGAAATANKVTALNEDDHITETPETPIDIYAHFDNVYTITFAVKDAATGNVTTYATKRVVGNHSLANDVLADTMPGALSEIGYQFTEWQYNGTAFTENTVVTDAMGNITVTATRSLKRYTISFGSTEQYIQNFTSDREFTVEDADYVLPTAEQVKKAGYTFTGWTLNGNAVTKISASDITASTPDTIVLTASFSLNTYTIDFGTAEQYIQNFTDDRTFTVEDADYVLPIAEQVKKAGYTFTGWTYDGNAVTKITASDITVDTPLTITLTADFSLNTYTIDFGEAEQYIQNFTNDRTFTVEDVDYVLPIAEQVQRAGYTFIEWTYNGTPVTKITASDITVDTPLTIVLTADFSLNTYTIDFGEAEQYIQNFTDDRTFTVEDADYVLPTEEQVKNAGYRFTGWTLNGNAITKITASDITVDTPDTIVLTAGFEMITYTIEYVGEGTDFTFKSGYQAPRSYDVTNYTTIVLPKEENVVLPDSKSFLGWMDGTSAITALTVAHLTAYPDTTLELSLNDETLFKVTFFEGYNQTYQVGDSLYVPALNAGLGDSIPTIPAYIQRRGYIKGPDDDNRADIAITSLYPNREIHTIRPTYWYEVTKEVDDGNGGTKLVTSLESFTEKTPIIADTNVYILYQKINWNIKIGSGANEELSISTSYKSAGTADDAYMTDKDTRIMDAAKDFALSGRNQFELAMENGWLPSQFDTAQEKLFGKLESMDILDSNKMIKILDIPIPISTLVKREKADDMVKQYIRDAITNPDKLDSLLDSMDIQAFIDQIGTDDLLAMLSNAQIANALTDINNRETIVSFIMDDLKAENPTLLTPLKNYILGNPTALNELAVRLKTQLSADTPAGASLRRMVLTSTELEGVLKQDAVKVSVIDKITGLDADDAILDILLNNEQVRHDLLDEAVKDDDFVSAMAKAQQFKDYAGSMLRQDLDVKAAVLDALDTDLLSELRGNTSFKAQFEMGAVLRTELENTIGLNTYVSDIDDLIEYLFGKPSTKTYTFINGEDVFRTIYDGEQGAGSYDALTDDEKNQWKTEAYDELAFDLTLKQDLIDELENQFVSYFADILDALATGAAISDVDMMDLIDTEIKNYIRAYVNDPLSLSVNVKNAIEDALVSYICDLLHQDDATITDANLRNIRRLILEKAYKNDQITSFIREFVKTDSHAETLIDHAYDVLDHDFVEIVHNMAEDSPEYATVEGLLKSISANIDATALTNIIASNGENTAVIDLVKDYVKDPTYATKIQGYVGGFLETDVDEAFVAEYRADIINALKNVDISSMIDKDMIKKHINELPTKDEKIAFADKIYNALANSSDYETLMDSLFGKKTFAITKSNLPLVQAISNAIGELEYDKVMAETSNAMLNKVIDVMGDAFLKDYFNATRDSYAEGLDAVIETVKNGSEGTIEHYTTSLTLSVNLIGDILRPLYDKAQVEVDEKLRKLPIRYDQNQYAQYLVQHDMLSKIFSGDGVETEEHSGYGIKEILDYYDYIWELFVVADDAICWYGDDNNVTQEEFDSIYDAAFGKVQLVQDKINSILEAYHESGEMPDKIKAVFDRVQQLNSVITRFDPQIQAMLDKYLSSSATQAGVAMGESEKIRTFVDWMFGQEDPVFTIDSLYDIFYRFDAKMQEGLQKLIDSGKLRAAIDKFEETSFGSLLKGKGTIGNVAEKIDAIKNGEKVTESLNSIYELMEIVAATGIDAFRVDTGVITDKDVYRFSVGPITFTMTRKYE